MGHVERKQREKENVKKSILAAAVKIAVADGWHSVTIRKIAEAIEYTPPIVYEHFENKEDLIRELVISGFRAVIQQYEKVQSKDLDPESKLIEFSLVHWDFAETNKELYRLMFSLERSEPDEEAMKGLLLIKETVKKISGKNDDESMPIILNWICLLIGTISVMMQFENNIKCFEMNLKPRELFISFIKSFVAGIK